MAHEAIGDSAVLIKENHPRIAMALSPTYPLIQGLGDPQILSILDQFESERLPFCAEWAQFLGAGAVIYDNQILNLRKNLGNVFEHSGARVIGNNHRANRSR